MRNLHARTVPSGVGLLSKAFQLLDLFTLERPTWTQAELVRTTGVPKSTVNRLVRYFCARGYLVFLEEHGRYGLGPAAIELGVRASSLFDLRAAAMPALRSLFERTNETVLLASYDPNSEEVVCVAQIPSAHEGLRVFRTVGARFPLHAGAIAKAVLAFLPRDVREAVLARPLDRIAEHTLTDPAVLAHDLAEIRARGYSISREETSPGVYGIGAPVFGVHRAVAGSIAVAAPLFRMTSGNMLDYARYVVEAADEISRSLGRVVRGCDAATPAAT